MFVLESIPADFSRCSKCEGGCFRKLIPLSGPILALEQVIMQSKFLFQCGGGGGKSEEPLNPSRDIFWDLCNTYWNAHNYHHFKWTNAVYISKVFGTVWNPLLSLVDFLKHPSCLDLLNQVSVSSRGSTKNSRNKAKRTKTQAKKPKTQKSGKFST